MTAGTYCLGPWAHRHWQQWCSWPAYLRVWLERAFPGRTLRMVNAATGGTDTAVWASMGVSELPDVRDADLVIVEMSVNDQVSDANGVLLASRQGWTIADASRLLFEDLLDLPRRPAVIALEAVRGAFSDDYRQNFKEAHLQCPEAHPEIRTPSNWSLEDGKHRWCPNWWMPPTWRAPVLEELGIPVVQCERLLHHSWSCTTPI